MSNGSHRSPPWPFVLAGATALAAFLFLWQLGASSFFIDEAASIRLIELPLGDLIPRLTEAENSPAGYFAALHLWTELAGSRSEWVVRLPSALAGIALVPAVWWLGNLLDGRRAALVAVLLTAISPLVLQYAQQARAYAIAMLALTLAAGAAVQAVRRRSTGWALAGAGGCALALSLHYAALAVVAPLCLWALLQRDAGSRVRLLFCGVPGAVWLAWLPLAIAQRQDHPTSQLADYGTFTAGHLVRVAAAPFDDRYTIQAGALKAVAAAAVAVAFVLVAQRAREHEHRELVLPLGIVAASVLALCAGSLAGIEILNSRYMTFSAPFMLVVVGSAVAHAPRIAGAAVLAVLVVAAAVYTAGSHRTEGFYPDTRGVVEEIGSRWRAGDVVLELTTLGVQFPLRFYAERDLPSAAEPVQAMDPRVVRLLEGATRVWIVREEKLAPVAGAVPPEGYHRVSLRRFPSSAELTLELARR